MGCYGEPGATDADEYDLPPVAGADFTLFDSVQEPDEYDWDGDEPLLRVWHAPIVSTPGRFDDLFIAAADGRPALILFANLTTGEAYTPYHGGADLFLSSSARRDSLKHKYRAWLSKNPDGY